MGLTEETVGISREVLAEQQQPLLMQRLGLQEKVRQLDFLFLVLVAEAGEDRPDQVSES
jgi:hypothetical protein